MIRECRPCSARARFSSASPATPSALRASGYYGRPACAAACMARASSSLRSGTSRASCSVVGDVVRPRCSNALSDLAAARLARSPMPTPASGLCHAACLSSKTRTATRHAKPSGSSHAQPLTVMPPLIPALQRPRPVTLAAGREEQQVRRSPMRCRYRDLDLLVPCRRPRRPRMSRAGQARHVSCKIPGALAPSMRHTHRVNA